MEFKAKVPIISVNDYPLHFLQKVVLDYGMALSIVLPRTDTSNLYVKITPKVFFRLAPDTPSLFSLQIESEFFLSPIFDENERDKFIYSLIRTAILNFNDLLSTINNIPPPIKSNIFFDTPAEQSCKEPIKKSILINQSN